jgi:acyl dehydratase
MTTPRTLPAPRSVGPITQTDIVRFAGAGGDFNPLHHDPDRARAAGFDAPIAMGQFSAGLLASWVTDWCGVENLRTFEVRFTSPLCIGDTAEMSSTIVEQDDASVLLDLAVRAGGRTVVTGRARVAVAL